MEVERIANHDCGVVFETGQDLVYVPHDTVTESDQAGPDALEEAVVAAVSPNRETPVGCVVFDQRTSGYRTPQDRADIWASLVDRLEPEGLLDWRPPVQGDVERVRLPVMVAADGSSAIAAYLAVCGFSNGEIADALDVGSRSVSQYISDLR